MKVYAETSAVLRWLFNDEHAEEVLDRLSSAEKVVCSRLTLIETRRSILREVGGSAISETDAAEIRSALAQAAARWAILEISVDVAARAEQTFPVEPIRTLDAIHLASALVLRETIPDLTVLSTDDRMRRNARLLGFEVFPEYA